MIWDTLGNIPLPQLVAFVSGGLVLNAAPGQDVFFATASGVQRQALPVAACAPSQPQGQGFIAATSWNRAG